MNIFISRTILSVFVGLLSLAVGALADDWPMWRGKTGVGITTEENLPLRWSATENILWKVPLPDRGNSTPAVWKNNIFVTQAMKDHRRTVICFDRKTGKQLWQSGTSYSEPESTHEDNPYCAGSPATDGERVIACFGSAGTFCYDLQGKQLWQRDLGKQSHIWGNSSSPVLHGDFCYVYFGPGTNSFLFALDKKTGKTVWKYDEPLSSPTERTDGFKGQRNGVVCSFSTPILIKALGREELVMSFPERIRAFAPATGKLLWHCGGLNPLIYTSPIAHEDVVVAMGGFSGTTVTVRGGGNGDVTETHRLWQDIRTPQRLGSGVIKNGYIYVLNTPGIAECIELKTGKTVWEERLRGPGAKSESWSSMVLSGDKIYVPNQSGETFVLRAAPKFEVLATNSIAEFVNASPVVSNGEIFVRSFENLWCISETRRAGR